MDARKQLRLIVIFLMTFVLSLSAVAGAQSAGGGGAGGGAGSGSGGSGGGAGGVGSGGASGSSGSATGPGGTITTGGSAQQTAGMAMLPAVPSPAGAIQVPDVSAPANFGPALQLLILLTVLSLAPSILIMMTSFTRIVIVLSLLRQALGTQQLPPNQILIGLSLFMTFLVMGPSWQRVNNEALQPYLNGQIDQKTALDRVEVPLRDFMIKQIIEWKNEEDVKMFHEFAHAGETPAEQEKSAIKSWSDVTTLTLIPAFMLSELKTAFFMGFKIYLPFLVIDMVISAILISMGMMMLPPVLISLPFKLLLFVLVDGWRLITASLMGSFVT